MTSADAKTVLVTGASSGFGDATARRFAALGWRVIGAARREDRLRALADEIGLRPVVADVTTEAGVAAIRDAVGDAPLHALVNNAGGAFGLASVEDADVRDWRAMYEVNVIATQQVTSALLPALRRGASASGVADIVGVTSIAGQIAYEGGAGYNAAKFAQHALLLALRLELSGEPLRVIEIAPGMARTEFSLVRFGGDAARADAVYEGIEHPLVADDVAEAIVHAVTRPPHVDLDLVIVKPVAQAAPHKVAKGHLIPKG